MANLNSTPEFPSLTTYPLTHTTPNGRVFAYTLTRHTRKSYSFESNRTDVKKSFDSVEAFQTYWRELKAWLNTMNPAEEIKRLPARIPVREEAKIAAVAAPSVEQVIRLSESAPADVSFCKACREAISGDGNLCGSCEQTQRQIIAAEDTAAKLHDLKNQLKKLFIEKMSLNEFKAKRQALLDEIKALEVQPSVSPHIGATIEGEYFFKVDLALALAKFTQKHGRPTQLKISKYDHIPADIDVIGIDVQRSSHILPGDVWMAAPKRNGAQRVSRTVAASEPKEPKQEEVIRINVTKPKPELVMAYAYNPNEGERSNGAYHIVVKSYYKHGRLIRQAGSALCKPKFWGLDGRPDMEIGAKGTCKRCIGIARKHGLIGGEGKQSS